MASQLEIEKKWQQFWKESKTFVPSVDTSKEKYFGTVAYPYANSALHIGHGRMNTAADIFLRYQRVKGHNVLFPMGFHISGTPVLAVADGIKRKDPKQVQITKEAIAEYISDPAEQEKILASFTDPFAIAEFFSNEIEDTFNTVGLAIDWTKKFSTGDEAYKKFISWQFKKLEDAGVLVQGKYPILYSHVDENAVGEDDIKDGDLDKVTVSEMKYIQFKLTDSDEYLVAATLRPDSLFGATNIYIKPDMKLVKLKVDGDVWIVSKASQVKIEHQFDKVEFISEHIGEEFLDKEAIVPILNTTVPVYPMNYPDENHGTGIVYSSPADSPHDYIFLFEIKFPGKSLADYETDPLELTPITSTKDKKGNEIKYKSGIPAFDKLHKYKIYSTQGTEELLERAKEELYKEAHYGAVMINCGEFDGTPLKNNLGAQKVVAKLDELHLGGLFFETSRRAVTRAGNQVIVANLQGQWFLDYSHETTKGKAHAVLDQMTFLPKVLRDTQSGYLDWVQKRPCARKRGIGTPLPQDNDWVIEPLSDSTIYQLYYPLAGFINEGKLSPDELTEEFLDWLFLGKGSTDHPHAQEIKEASEYFAGIDLRYTAATHMSNHLSFLIYHYGLILPEHYWPKNITIGGMLIKDGEKISKSKGNGIPLIQVREKYGADLYRLYISVGTSYDSEFDFREEDIFQVQKKFDRWKELMFAAKKSKKKSYDEFGNIDKWLISRFYTHVDEYFAAMDEVGFREGYVAVLYEFLNDIFYHMRRTQKEQTLEVLRFVFVDYITLMTPAVPHVCEELFVGEDEGVISLRAYDTKGSTYINKDIEDVESMTQELLRLITFTKDRKEMGQLKKITIVQAKSDRFGLFDDLKKLLTKTKEFKQILPELMKNHDDKQFITKFVPKTLGSGLQAYLPKADEKTYLESVREFISSEYGCPVELADADSMEIKQQAIPGSPAVLLE